jgi:hypothetical protein
LKLEPAFRTAVSVATNDVTTSSIWIMIPSFFGLSRFNAFTTAFIADAASTVAFHPPLETLYSVIIET